MDLQNLFVSYQQVDPVEINVPAPDLSDTLYVNLDRIKSILQQSESANEEYTQDDVNNILNHKNNSINSNKISNIKASDLKAYRGDRIKYWADKFAKLGFTPQQQVAVVASMMQECGLKPKGAVEKKELQGKGNTEAGWAGAGEGALGFTHWDLKSKMIKAYNNHPNRKGPKLSEIKSEYAKSSSRHIADLDDDDHALMVAIFYKQVLEKTKNMNFEDLIGEFYLEKAGRGASGKKGTTSAEKAFNRAKDYQVAHRNLGYVRASKVNGYEKAIADAKSVSQKLGISMA